MTTLLHKRMFHLNGKTYLYKKELTAPNEIQKVFGKVEDYEKNERLDFLPKRGIIHKIKYNSDINRPDSFEKMTKKMNDLGISELTQEESVHRSQGHLSYWVTLKGNKFETAYVTSTGDLNIKNPTVRTAVTERDYEGLPIGYDKEYIKNNTTDLKYSYFPNFLDPRAKNLHPEMDILDEENILIKAKRLINRLKTIKFI